MTEVVGRCWEMSGDVERCIKMEILGYVERCSELSENIGMLWKISENVRKC